MTSRGGSLTIVYLGVLASLRVVDPTVTNTALVEAGRRTRQLLLVGAILLVLGFHQDFATSGALVNGFGVTNLRQRLLNQGINPATIPALLSQARAVLNHGVPPGASQPSRDLLGAIHAAYASGLAGTMLVAALGVALLMIISLLLLVIGALQGPTEGRREDQLAPR